MGVDPISNEKGSTFLVPMHIYFVSWQFPVWFFFLFIHFRIYTLDLCIFINVFISQLNGIERSLGLSANVRQCYELNKFSFDDAMNTAKSTAMQCINNKFNEGKTIADNAINNIRTAVQDVSNGAQLIAECRQFTITFPSVAGFVAKVTCFSQV